MKIDICLPDRNETELINRAKELNYDAVAFLYRFKSRGEILKKREELKDLKFPVFVGTYLDVKSPKDLKYLDKLYLNSDIIGAIAQKEELVRVCAENPRVDFLFEITTGTGREHTHYRNSNMTSVITGLMKKNKCSYAISFSQILNVEGSARAKMLGRIMQNVRLLRRKIPILIASFARDASEVRLPENLAAVSRVLGLNFPQSKAAIGKNIEEIIKQKERRRDKNFIRPGVKIVD
ncbi:MAG: RNase P subunit p30 family protein [Nanoarchaeota archaeon]